MPNNALQRIVEHKVARFLTPFIERLVHGLVYPAVLGASLVEATLKIRDFYAPIPWILVIALFAFDYALTGGETSERPPKGNVLLAFADLVAAAAFVGSYVVSAAWDGTRHFSEAEIKHLVWVMFGYQFSLSLWYIFRWSTQNLSGLGEPVASRYRGFLKVNFILAGLQSIFVVILGTLVLLERVPVVVTFMLILGIAFSGLAIRNWRELQQGPWNQGG